VAAPATSIEQMAADAITFIKAMGFEQVDLFGFSMGGMIAQEIALMEPHRTQDDHRGDGPRRRRRHQIGRTIALNGATFTVVGVASADFTGLDVASSRGSVGAAVGRCAPSSRT
jgi:pimeloyl-ACP methyl ester carboxylesterase